MVDVVKTFEFKAKAVADDVAMQPQHAEQADTQAPTVDLEHELAQLSKQARQSLLLQAFKEDLDHLVKLETDKGREQGYRAGTEKAADELAAMKAEWAQQQQDHLDNLNSLKATLESLSPTIEISEPEALVDIVNQAVYVYLGERLEDKSYLKTLLAEIANKYAEDKQVVLRLGETEFDFLQQSGLLEEFNGQIKLEKDAALTAGSHKLCLSNGDKHSDLSNKLKQQLDAFLVGLKG
ncbi:hypothetical protein L1286_22340 [Pseudoalteromonas sp. SMS1]|uniref:FliH/SctL family protein n=1 Tax=Pseudoalteromonas sp. SMS1 TaxID=2908894 RepID=UPI001F2853AB|nr:hypothetical protein [Pseudoalteromonas sp. SMS1]MCF2860224.1 hypothetical protein [Pseudoalteromonas sp. SMS1]